MYLYLISMVKNYRCFLTYHHSKTGLFSHSASENNIHNTYSAINNGIEFFDVLVNSPFYTRFSPQIRYALWVFCKSTSDISPDMSSAGQ